MKRKGWLIVGGLALLWLSPFFIFLGKGAWSSYWKADYDRRAEAWAKRMKENIKYDAVTDEDRRRWKEQAERERIEAEKMRVQAELEKDRQKEMERKRIASLASSGYWRPPLDDEDEYGNPIQYRTKVIYVEKETPYYQRRQEQPDLTGAYWERDFGTFKYVLGPL